jgi:transposase
VKAFERELARYCTVVSIAEYRTSKVHYDCVYELKNQFSQRLCRDVNAARNMRRLLECKLRGEDRSAAHTRQAWT